MNKRLLFGSLTFAAATILAAVMLLACVGFVIAFEWVLNRGMPIWALWLLGSLLLGGAITLAFALEGGFDVEDGA